MQGNGLWLERTKQLLCPALSKCFEYTADTVRTQVRDISHTESLVQPFENAHTINWLLGHIVSARTTPLTLVGAKTVWSDKSRARYRHGSSPIKGQDESVLQFDVLEGLFIQTQYRFQAGLQTMDDDALLQPSGHGHNGVFNSLLYFHFHESYHVGQMTMVAEALGKPAAYLASSTS